jgi:hypothetical protein
MKDGTIDPLILSLTATSLWNRKNSTEHLEFKDTKAQPLEAMLDKVIIGMFASANKLIANDELYNRELEKKWEEESKQNRLREMRRKEEENIKKLEKIVSDWDFAQKIRAFADSLEMRATLENNENEQKQIKEWSKWVRSKADWLDPLKEDELLGKHPHHSRYNKTI